MATKKVEKKPKTKKKPSKKPAIIRLTRKIDATDQVLGRLASQIAILLRGKDKPEFVPYLDLGDNIVVQNAKKIKITGRKLQNKIYYRHSGYPGGIKSRKMSEIFEKNPGELLKKAVWNMLPKNKLRAKMIKRLKITN